MNPKNGEIKTIWIGDAKVPLELVFVEGSQNIRSFWLGRYPVTQAQWQAVMQGENPSRFVGDNRPVERVSWNDITQTQKEAGSDGFLSRLKSVAQPSMDFRLPLEKEWEYAARGGKTHSPFKYAGSDDLHEVGWYDDNSHRETKPVGLKKANDLGLYDMSGNVWEWCNDLYSSEGSDRVMRGGSWLNFAIDCRVADRGSDAPSGRGDSAGFRLCCSP